MDGKRKSGRLLPSEVSPCAKGRPSSEKMVFRCSSSDLPARLLRRLEIQLAKITNSSESSASLRPTALLKENFPLTPKAGSMQYPDLLPDVSHESYAIYGRPKSGHSSIARVLGKESGCLSVRQ